MRKILKNTWRILTQKEKKQFCVLLLLDVIVSLADILSLVSLLWIINFYTQSQEPSRTPLPGWMMDKNSIFLIGLFFILFTIKNILAFLIIRTQNKFIGQLAVRISHCNLVNYQHAAFQEFIYTDSSVQIRKTGFQPFEFCQYIVSGIQQITTQVVLIFLSLVAIILFNAHLFFMLLLILLPPVVIVFYLVKKRMTLIRSEIQSNNERSFQYLLDALKGYVEGNIYQRNNFFAQRFVTARKKFASALFELLTLQSMPSRIIEIFAVLGLLILIIVATWTGHAKGPGFLTIGAFMAAAYKIIPGIVKVINTSGQMKTFESSLESLVENITEENLFRNTVPSTINSIEFKNLSFHYDSITVVNDFNLKAQKGDLVGITGTSGKGKTTLFNLLLGFLKPANGEILVNDTVASENELKNYWPSVAYVRQQPFLIHDTLVRNIILQETEMDIEKLEHALKTSGVKEMLNNFPEGLDKIITENGKNISGGQQQRIILARAIYKNADLILLDEPFNELDEASEIILLKHFRELAQTGCIVLMITHSKKSLSYCTKIVSLDD